MAVQSIRTCPKPVALTTTYPVRGQYIYQQVSTFKLNKIWPLFRLASPTNAPTAIYDLAVIICSYGHDPARIAASIAALTWMVKAKPSPHIYFVEAAKSGETYEFEELLSTKKNVTYIKKELPVGSDGGWFKEALWTIGANYAIADNVKITKLCFIDSDVEFVDQMWALEVSKALNTYDCISPHSHFYYEGTAEVADFGLMPSTGYAFSEHKDVVHSPGMAFACTVDFFKNRLDSRIHDVACGSGDMYLWYTILGITSIKYDYNRLPYHNTFPTELGLKPPAKVGHAAQIAVHRYHGPIVSRLYPQRKLMLKRAVDTPFKEFTYLDSGLPVWSDTPGGRILSRTFPYIYSTAATPITIEQTQKLYADEAIVEYGAISETYPLVVACVLPDDSNDSISKVVVLKNQFAEKCKVAHRFVCITNKVIPNVETIAPVLDIPGYNGALQTIASLNVDANTSVLYCDINTVICADLYPHRCPENSVNMLRAREVLSPIKWGVWNANVVYYRGAFSDIAAGLDDDIDYQYSGAEELLMKLFLTNEIYPNSIEQHFCTRFYRPNITQPGVELMVFYNIDPSELDILGLPDYNVDIYAV